MADPDGANGQNRGKDKDDVTKEAERKARAERARKKKEREMLVQEEIRTQLAALLPGQGSSQSHASQASLATAIDHGLPLTQSGELGFETT